MVNSNTAMLEWTGAEDAVWIGAEQCSSQRQHFPIPKLSQFCTLWLEACEPYGFCNLTTQLHKGEECDFQHFPIQGLFRVLNYT